MADVDGIWADMQANDSRARAKAVDRLLHGAPPKRNKTKKKSTQSTAIVVEQVRQESEAPAVAEENPQEEENAPSSAVALLRRLARAVQQVNDDAATARRQGLDTLSSVFLERRQIDTMPEGTVGEMLAVLSQPLLRRFEDPVERHRSTAIRLYTALVERAPDLSPHLPYLFPMLERRASPAAGFDAGVSLFVFDREAHDAFKRGKAVQRSDFNMALERERVVTVCEPSEELRLTLCELLDALVRKMTPNRAAAYLHETLLILAGFMRDPYGEIQIRAANAISSICAMQPLQEVLVPYGSALARVVAPSLRHRHARVRAAAVRAVRRSVAIEHKAKWKGAGTDAIADLVGFREDNVVPTSSFYITETRYNYVADLTRDASALVRRETAECVAEWFTRLLDRRDHQPRLLAYMLNFTIDDDSEVRRVALDGIEVAGREFVDEARGQEIIEKLQYGVDGEQRANHDPAGLPWPFEARPPLGARLIVRAFAYRIVRPVLEELANWRGTARHQSAKLLSVLCVYCEEHLTQELAKIVAAVCRALRVLRREHYDGRALVLECCAVLGRYVVPESSIQFLAPRIKGDLEVLPGGTDAASRADVVDILAALLRGAKASAVLPQFANIVAVLADDELATAHDPLLKKAALGAIAGLLATLSTRGRAALDAVFVATGRLDAIDTTLAAVFRAVLTWRDDKECRDVADKALASLAALEQSPSVTALALRRCLPLMNVDDFDLLEQGLSLVDDAKPPSTPGGLVVLLTTALDLFRVLDEPDLVARLAHALCRPLRLASLLQQCTDIHQVAVNLLRDVALAEELWDEGGDGQAALLGALTTPPSDNAAPLVSICVIAELGGDICRALTRQLTATKHRLDALAHVLSACCPPGNFTSSKGGRRRLVPFRHRRNPDAVWNEAGAFSYASSQLVEAETRAAALDVMWELVFHVTPHEFDGFITRLIPLLPSSSSEDEKEDTFGLQVDALLRLAAVCDPDAFTTVVRAAPRTSTLAALEEHAALLQQLSRD